MCQLFVKRAYGESKLEQKNLNHEGTKFTKEHEKGDS
jgi:hypothetical protein